MFSFSFTLIALECHSIFFSSRKIHCYLCYYYSHYYLFCNSYGKRQSLTKNILLKFFKFCNLFEDLLSNQGKGKYDR